VCRHIMDYYHYINHQRQASVHDRHSSTANFADAGDTGVDVAASPFSLAAGGLGSAGARYSSTGILAHCAGGGQLHLAGRLDGSALANGGDLSPRHQDSASYGRPFTAMTQDAGSVDTPKYGGTTQRSASMTANNHHGEPATSQPQRPRYMPPPLGTVLPPLDDDDDDDGSATAEDNDDDDGAASAAGDGRSSAASTRSSASDSRHPACSSDDVQTDGRDSTTSETSDKTSTNSAAGVGAASTEPFIYPWMRRVHSSNNGMNYLHVTVRNP